VHLWVEAEGHRDAGRWTEAAGLAERVLQRVEQGEAMPSGLGLDQVRLLAAGWALRAGTLTVAEAQARRVLESAKAAAWHGEARLIRGVALLGLERGAEAETILEPLAADVRWRDRVGLLRAVAARAAGRLDRAAELLAERVRTAGGEEEKGEAAWAWAEVELERGDPEAAWTALKQLLERSGAGGNPAAAGLLALRTMDLARRCSPPMRSRRRNCSGGATWWEAVMARVGRAWRAGGGSSSADASPRPGRRWRPGRTLMRMC
jgi:tetratricopeptide (TPR) repeat protein